jgi:transcription elongation factor GreB
MADLPILITPQGFRRLQQEMQWLWKVERPRVTSEVAAAAALGDRSENAEYIYGKRRLREIDSRLRYLSKRMDRMQVIALEAQRRSRGRVGFGAWVKVEDEDGAESNYRIVGPDEFDPDRGYISVESPVGRALLGKEVDDEVEVHRPKGTVVLTILEIEYRED